MKARLAPGEWMVLTADVVSSRDIPAALLESRMSEISKHLEKQLSSRRPLFEFYRGDSFQALVPATEALRIALLWRAGMKATGGDYDWDIRIAIGAGGISHIGKSLASSGGPAFQASGTLLDSMKRNYDSRIAFQTEDKKQTAALNTECLLAEAIIGRWTVIGAQTVYSMLYFSDTQEALAARMHVSQPAIHKRLQAANWTAIRHWEAHYRQTVQ